MFLLNAYVCMCSLLGTERRWAYHIVRWEGNGRKWKEDGEEGEELLLREGCDILEACQCTMS